MEKANCSALVGPGPGSGSWAGAGMQQAAASHRPAMRRRRENMPGTLGQDAAPEQSQMASFCGL